MRTARTLVLGLAALVGLLAMAAPLRAQDMPDNPACFDAWVRHVGEVLNSYRGDAEFNARKAWSINRYGIFVGRGIASNFEPDTWAQHGATRNGWMWNTYTSELKYPDWNNANFNAAGLLGLRWFVRDCDGSGVAAAPPSTTVGTAPAPALDPSATCPPNFSMHQGSTLTMICYCAPDRMRGSVWGSGTYTHDSALCAAALHAGAVAPGGGMVVVRGAPGQSAYQGTASNGVTTSNYGAYPWSYVFPDAAPAVATDPSAAACPGTMTDLRGTTQSRTCHCAPGTMSGAVWGSGPYTDDSSICAAALHAGIIGTSGGTVTAVASEGLGTYVGSTRNGVSSADYGRWHGSFWFR